jgi:hypothetical protein
VSFIKNKVRKPATFDRYNVYTIRTNTQTVMRNLCLRFVLALLVTGFTYIAFVSGTIDVTTTRHIVSPISFGDLLAQSKQESNNTNILHEDHIRKLNYASFRKSLLRHRSIYYANQD